MLPLRRSLQIWRRLLVRDGWALAVWVLLAVLIFGTPTSSPLR
ncbi:MAG: hypothetical protein R2856_11675 [Caldilineaceae bacterium]